MVIVDNEESRSYIFDPYRGDLDESGIYISQGLHDELIPDELSIIYEEEGIVMNSLTASDTKCNPVKETKDAPDALDAIETMTSDGHIPVTHKHEEFQTKKIHDAGIGTESPIEAELSGVCHQIPDVTEVVDRVIMWRGAATNVMVTGEFSNWSPLSLSSVGHDLWLLNLKLQRKDHLMKYMVDGKDLVSDDMERTKGPNNEIFNILRFEEEEDLDQVQMLRSLKGSPLDSMKDSGYDQSFEERKQSSSSIGSFTSEEENNSQILESSSSDSSLSHDVNEVSPAYNSIPLIRNEENQLTVFLGQGQDNLVKPTKPDINLTPLVRNEQEQLTVFLGELKPNVENDENGIQKFNNSIPLSRNENEQLSVFLGSNGSEISSLNGLTNSIISESLKEEQHKIESQQFHKGSVIEESLANAYKLEKERICQELEEINYSSVNKISYVEDLDKIVEDRVAKELLKNCLQEQDETICGAKDPLDYYYALENERISEELTKSPQDINSSNLMDHNLDIKTEERVSKETNNFIIAQKNVILTDKQNFDMICDLEKKRIQEETSRTQQDTNCVLQPELENDVQSNVIKNIARLLNEYEIIHEQKQDVKINFSVLEKIEQSKLEEESRLAELEKIEEQKKQAEQVRIEEDRRQADQERIEEEKRQAKLKRLEQERIEEEKRQADLEIMEQERLEDRKRQEELEMLEKQRIEEEKRQAELERLEQERIEEEKRKAEQERIEEEKRQAELERLEKEKEKKRIEEEKRQAEQERIEEEKRQAELKRIEQERIEEEKRKAEQERIEEEKRQAELERLEKERIEEEKRQAEQEIIEEEKRQAELKRLEEERIEKEKRQAELERLEKERIEEEKRKAEQERIEEEKRQAELERLEKERKEEERRQAELERLEKEKIDEEKRQAELERLEKERIEKERRKAEQERIEEEKRQAELERLEKERLEEEKRQDELERLEKEIIEEEKRKAEQERLEKERLEEEKRRAELERLEKERIEEEKRKAEQEKIEEEKRQAELERLENEKIEEQKRKAELERSEKDRIEEQKRQAEVERLEKERIEEEKRRTEQERMDEGKRQAELERFEKENNAMEEGLAEFEKLESKKGNTNLAFIDVDEDKPQVVTVEPKAGPVVIEINDDPEINDDAIINGMNAVETNIARIQDAVSVQERHIDDVESGPSSLVSNQKTPVMKKIYGLCSCNIL